MFTFRAGTREVHNKLEKERRAQLKECYDQLKKELPMRDEDRKKTSNLTILEKAHEYVQVRNLEHGELVKFDGEIIVLSS